MKKIAYFLLKSICCIILSLLVFIWSGLPSFTLAAFAKPNPTTPLSPAGQGLTNTQEFERFIDQFWGNFKAAHIPGMTFVLVKDGKIFFSKGYGYANIEEKTPVIPDRTLFRLGSISKVLTTTAVMQLVEGGKLNLNEDINKYLKAFQIKNNNFKPITSDHLLTHTDGFDVAWTIGGGTRCESKMPSLEAFLRDHLPQQVRQPGEFYVYGDVGMSLAGYLVEVLSGEPFTQYVEKHILEPLDMRHSSFQQPLPTNLSPNLAAGYNYKNGRYIKTPFTCGKSSPTIGLSATATDMAHFMIAQLQGGSYGKQRILQENTVAEMNRQHFTNFPNHDGMSGSAYGFYERFQNNQRGLEHGGSMYGYSSQFFMLPEHNLGLFFAFNNDDTTNIRENLIVKFLERYYPEPKDKDPLPQPKLTAESQQRLAQMDGSYRFIRYPQHSLVKLWIVWFGPRPDLGLKTNSDGTVSVLPRGTKWVEVEPWLLRYKDTNNYINFRRDGEGKVTNISLSNYVFITYDKLDWYETVTFQRVLFGFCVVMFLSAFWVWPIRGLIRNSSPASRVTGILRLLVGLIGILNVSFMIGMFLVILQIGYWEFFFGMPAIVVALLYLPIFTTGMATGLPIVGWLAWQDKSWSIIGRVHYILIVLAAGVFIVLLNYWNLLGFRF